MIMTQNGVDNAKSQLLVNTHDIIASWISYDSWADTHYTQVREMYLLKVAYLAMESCIRHRKDSQSRC